MPPPHDRTGQWMILRLRCCIQLQIRCCVCGIIVVENRIETIHIVGGGSQNQLLCQMTADACHRKVIAGPVEATAIGNVMMQMIGTDSLDSVAAGRILVQKSFDTQLFEPQTPDAWTEPASRFAKL